MWGLRESTINSGLGHLQIYKAGYNGRGSESHLKYVIENQKEVLGSLLKTAHVQEVTSELEVNGLLSGGESSVMTICRGMDLSSVSIIKSSFDIVEGDFITGESDYQIALGTLLADKLNASVGTWLTFMTTTKDGALNAVDVEVVSIIKTGVKDYDSMISIVPITLARTLVDVNAVEKYVVMLDKTEYVDLVHKELLKKNSEQQLSIEIKLWTELADFYHKVKSMNESYYTITQLIILLIVGFSIVNTMRMVIYERMREIGTIRAIGMTRNRVILMFLYEGIWLGIFALIVGIVLSHIVSFLINVAGGIYIAPPPGRTEGYHAQIKPDFIRYIQVSVIVFLSVVGGTLIPAYRAAAVKIDEALRYV